MRLFSFAGEIRPLPYALSSLVVFFSQHVAVLLALRRVGQPLELDWQFLVAPLRALVMLNPSSGVLLTLGLAYMLLAAWALAALAFRRAANAGLDAWIAAYAIAPLVQIAVIPLLSVYPPRAAAERPAPVGQTAAAQSGWTSAALELMAGMGLTLFAVAVGAALGVYGYGLFVISPFVIGAMTAYLANRTSDVGAWRTSQLVAGATLLGGIALIVVALEGAVCLVLIAPLGLAAALVGGFLGRGIALYAHGSARQTLSGVALLPLVFALETVLTATTSFDTTETIAIEAPPEAVWRALVQMEPLAEPPALPFRLGVAYPRSGEIAGEGVGAIRRGEFSTGTAIERVTEWAPGRKLAFVVVDDVPAMRELSPYPHVHAPHVIGYFRTTLTSFEIVPRSATSSTLVERTSHELRLEPVFYWLPLARWVVHLNNARVLAHIRAQAERSATASR